MIYKAEPKTKFLVPTRLYTLCFITKHVSVVFKKLRNQCIIQQHIRNWVLWSGKLKLVITLFLHKAWQENESNCSRSPLPTKAGLFLPSRAGGSPPPCRGSERTEESEGFPVRPRWASPSVNLTSLSDGAAPARESNWLQKSDRAVHSWTGKMLIIWLQISQRLKATRKWTEFILFVNY